MMTFPLANVSPIMTIVMFLWIFVAIALILIILVQKGRGGGLSAAFGGGASSLMGTKTGDFLTWVTISLVALFLFLAIIMVKFYKPRSSSDLGAPPPASTAPMNTQQQVPPGVPTE